MNIAIYDLFLGSCTFHTTPRPSKGGMLISGWHKAKGDTVVLLDEEPNFRLYDKVYIIREKEDLVYKPNWLGRNNIVLIGDWDGYEYWNSDWEEAVPDSMVYRAWAEDWMERYPTVSMPRMENFFRTPFLMHRKGKIFQPEGHDIVIIDDDILDWDIEGVWVATSEIKKGLLLYPLYPKTIREWEAAMTIHEARNIRRRNWWIDFDSTITDEELFQVSNLINEYGLGRSFRMKVHGRGNNDTEWRKELPRLYEILAHFRIHSGKRVWCEVHNRDAFEYPRILIELKRWSAMNQGYNKNSLFTYIVYDGCRNIESLTEFFYDPYEYLKKKKQGSNKFKELVRFMENEPELMEIITTSYEESGY